MADEPVRITTDGWRLTDRRLRRGMRLSITASCLAMFWVATCQGMPLQMFMEALGAKGVMIGLVLTVTQFSMIVQLPAAWFAERLSDRKRIWAVTGFLHRFVWFVPAGMAIWWAGGGYAAAWVVVGVMLVSAVLNNIATAPWFSWMADLVPERMRGAFWGRRHSFTIGTMLVAMAVTGVVLDAFRAPAEAKGPGVGFAIVFGLAALLGCADIVLHFFVPEPRPEPTAGGPGWRECILRPLRNRDFLVLTLAMGVFHFAAGLISLWMVFLKREFGVTYTQIAAVNIAASLAAIPSGFAGGYLLHRIGGRAFAAVMTLTAPLVMVCWFLVRPGAYTFAEMMSGVPLAGAAVAAGAAWLPDPLGGLLTDFALPQAVWVLLPANFLAGVCHGGVALAQFDLAAAYSPREGRTMAMATHWSVVGLASAAGPLVAGRAMDWFAANPSDWVLPTGTRFGFHHALVVGHILLLWLVVLPLLSRIRRREHEPHVGRAFARLIVRNPLRLASDIYAVSGAVSRARRVRAVRGLGRSRTAIAVADLIEQLDDPSSDVREEAAHALGSIGGPEAVDALVARLDDPESDLAPQIARALRQTRDPRSVDALVRRLADPDRETRTEAARTLGAIGDPRAAPVLMDLLGGTDDPKILSASSEALARLGEIAAIYEILPRLKETRNPVLRRSLAVAVGDLLGERDGFYRVLTREQKSRGVEVERLMRDLRRRIGAATRKRMAGPGGILAGKTRELEDAYEEEDYRLCSEILFDLAIGLAALRWGIRYGGDGKAFVNDIVWRDLRFGVGVWYLDLLRHGWEEADLGARDAVDVLLGIYFLACRGLAPRGAPPPQGGQVPPVG